MERQDRTVFTGGRVVTTDGVKRTDVEVTEGKISRVGDVDPSDALVVDLQGAWLIPGLIDMHINDGVALLEGLTGPDEHADRLEEVSRGLAARGVTGAAPATLAAPVEEVEDYLRGMAEFVSRWRERPMGAELIGALVEGTFMNPANCGAHNPEYIFEPDRDILDRLLDTGVVRFVNIAPEFDGALELIEHAVSRGVVVGAGHCKPSADRLSAAVDRGLSYFIHLLNGPTGSSTKAFGGGGTLEGALRDDRVSVELIIDNIHIDPRVVRDVMSRKGYERVIAISDTLFPTEPPRGEFEISGILGKVDFERNYIYVSGRRDVDGNVVRPDPPTADTCDVSTLFGSVANMDDVFANTVGLLTREIEGNWVREHPALPLEEAVVHAVRMCCEVPARVAGIYGGESGNRVGAVAEGWRADLVAAEIDGAGEGVRFNPRQVYVAGSKLVG